jgi:hypothetical protein
MVTLPVCSLDAVVAVREGSKKYTGICLINGIDSIGIKIPEMSGSRTVFSTDMKSPGLPAG